jgi:hypothetical protein
MMKKIREMSIEEIKEDVERIKNKFPQLASSCDAIRFDRPKGAINREYKFLLEDVKSLEDTELQNFYKFKDCQSKLDNLKKQVSNYWECDISDFGEALATDREVAEKEYKALQDTYKELHDELYSIMKDAYKGYKAHCEFCRIPYSHYEEFEEANEDDLFASILGM